MGRDSEKQRLVALILAPGRGPIIVSGGPGIGKSTLARAAAHDLAVCRRFGERRIFVLLDAARSGTALLASVAQSLELDADGSTDAILDRIAALVANDPLLAILDNLETPWEAESGQTQRLVDQLGAIPRLTLIVTVRGGIPLLQRRRMLEDLSPLSSDAARQLFVQTAGERFEADPDLAGLLDDLDGHPMSIELLAGQADGATSLRILHERWREKRAALLVYASAQAEDRLTSVRASLRLSIQSQLMQDSGRRLLSLLALLPAGLTNTEIKALLPECPLEGIANLERLRLVYRSEGDRLRVLAPLRECANLDCPILDSDFAVFTAHFVKAGAAAWRIGTDALAIVSKLVADAAPNLDAALAEIVNRTNSIDDELLAALEGLSEYCRFTGLASVSSLKQASDRATEAEAHGAAARIFKGQGNVALARSDLAGAGTAFERALDLFEHVGDLFGQASCIERLGDTALERSEHDVARDAYEKALPLYRSVDSIVGQANCIKGLGDIAQIRSDHDNARVAHEKALDLFKSVGDILGQASCIESLGDIARERSNQHAAHVAYKEALPLYERAGSILGQANCIKGLGDLAFERSDYSPARDAYEKALLLYERVGDILGQGGCIERLGDIALERADHDTARVGYERALLLYKRAGSILGEANCIKGFGDIAQRRSELDVARVKYESALQLFGEIPEPYSMGWTYVALSRIAAAHAERERHRAEARTLWASIGRDDLIREHLDAKT